MEQVAVFEEKVAVYPGDLRADITSFDDILLGKLKAQLEGKCSKHGYVIPKTLTILSRSLGYAEKGRFTSDFLYYIKAQGKVYNPPDGTVVEGEVSRKSKAGLYVIVEGAVHIMIVRDLHIGNEEFDSIVIGDMIRIEIKRSRFQINDPHILSIGQFLGRVGGPGAAAAATEPLVAAEPLVAEAADADADADDAADDAANAAEAANLPEVGADEQISEDGED